MRTLLVRNDRLKEDFLIELYKTFSKLSIYNDEYGKVLLNSPIRLDIESNSVCLYTPNNFKGNLDYIKAIEWSIVKEDYLVKNISVLNNQIKRLTSSIASIRKDVIKEIKGDFRIVIHLEERVVKAGTTGSSTTKYLCSLQNKGCTYRYIQLRKDNEFIVDKHEINNIKARFVNKVKFILARLIVNHKLNGRCTIDLTFQSIHITSTLIDITYVIKVSSSNNKVSTYYWIEDSLSSLENIIKDLSGIVMNIKEEPLTISVDLQSASDLLFI